MSKKTAKKILAPANLSFAISADAVESHCAEFKRRKVRYRKATVRVGEYEVPACIFSAKTEGKFVDLSIEVLSIVPVIAFLPQFKFTCLDGDAEMVFFVASLGKVEIHWDGYDPEKEKAAVKREQYAQAAICYRGLLEQFAGIIGGWDIHFYTGSYGFIREPFAETPRCLHIFTNCVPPGEVSSCRRERMYNLPLAADGKEQVCLNFTPGRGITVEDDDSAVAQIVGSNFYFLAPVMSCFNKVSSAKIFELLLARCWNAYCDEKKEKKESKPVPLEQGTFMAAAYDWLSVLPQHLGRILAAENIKLLGKFEEIATIQKDIRQYTQLLEVMKSEQYVDNARNRLGEEWKKINALPDIEDLTIVDDGLHARTKPIAVKYNGAMYDVGSFVIRISKYGTISVWSENPTHPDRVPHPHIGKDGTPCFGNATEAIIRAASTFRLADAISYALRWLRDGYTPKQAPVKIEEWPVIPETAVKDAPKISEVAV